MRYALALMFAAASLISFSMLGLFVQSIDPNQAWIILPVGTFLFILSCGLAAFSFIALLEG